MNLMKGELTTKAEPQTPGTPRRKWLGTVIAAAAAVAGGGACWLQRMVRPLPETHQRQTIMETWNEHAVADLKRSGWNVLDAHNPDGGPMRTILTKWVTRGQSSALLEL